MADLEWLGEPDRPSLRRAIRHRLRHIDPALRVIAEGFLAERSEIDLLAVGAEGDLVSVRIGREGDDGSLLTRALSDLTWLRARRAHLLKLAPGLGLEPSAEPRAILLCPGFAAETCSAAENLPVHTIQRLSYRCLRVQGQLNVLLTDETRVDRKPRREIGAETDSPQRASEGGPRKRSPGRSPGRGPSRLTDPPSPSSFRTGLSEADLGRAARHTKSDATAPAGTPGSTRQIA